MKVSSLVLFAVCVVALFALTGCFGGGGGSSASGSGYGGGSSYAGGSGSTSGGSSGGSTPGSGALPHNPEPATLALLGSGLAAYALIRRKRKK